MECRLVGGSYIKTQTLYEEQIFNGWRESMLNDEGNVSLLKGYNARTPFDLHIIRRWVNSRSDSTFSAPVGVYHGKNEIYSFIIDHKSANGAVTGTCGSGKTEFLKTLVLSLAVNYPPTEVQFLIIEREYGEFREFERLPHCVGHAIINTRFGSNGYRIAIAIEKELE